MSYSEKEVFQKTYGKQITERLSQLNLEHLQSYVQTISQ